MSFFGKILDVGKKVLGGVVGGIPGALLGIGGDILSNELIGKPNAQEDYNRSVAGSALSFQQSQQAYKSRYQNTMQDMANAGLNPILAASSGFNVGNAPQMSAPISHPAQPYGNMTQSIKDISDVDKNISTIKEKSANTKKLINEAKVENEKINLIIKQTALTTTQEKKTWREVLNAEAQFYLLSQQIDKTKAEVQLTKYQTDVQHAQIELVNEQKKNLAQLTKKIIQEAKTIKLKLSQLRQISQIYDSAYGKKLQYTNEILKSLNLNFGIIGGFR